MISKKGESQAWSFSDWFMLIIYVLMVGGGVVFVLVFLGVFSINYSTPPVGLEESIIEERFFGSCFTSQGGEIDFAKFNQNQLDKCYKTSDDNFAYLLKLNTYEGERKLIILKTSNLDENSPRKTGEFRLVDVYQEGNIVRGGLTIERQIG